MKQVAHFALAAAAAVLCFACCEADLAAQAKGDAKAQQPKPQASSRCPAREEIDQALGQASALLELARYEDARQALKTLTECDARASLLMAGSFEASGDLARAEETLEKAHRLWPANTSIATSLAREYLSSQQPDKAVAALDHFHATHATPPQEMQEAVVVYLAGHRLVQAQAAAEATYERYPSLGSVLLLANVMQLEGRYKEVVKLLDREKEKYAASAAFLITRGESEYDAMLYDRARADMEEAIKLDGNSYQAHYLLGNVFVAQNELDQAEQEYRKAIALKPSQPRSYYQLAILLHNQQRDAEEEPLLKQALAADDRYAPAHCEMGRILLARRQLAEAVDELNLAIKYNSRLEQAYYLLARAYQGLGERDKADATAKQFAALRKANRNHPVDTLKDQVGMDTINHE